MHITTCYRLGLEPHEHRVLINFLHARGWSWRRDPLQKLMDECDLTAADMEELRAETIRAVEWFADYPSQGIGGTYPTEEQTTVSRIATELQRWAAGEAGGCDERDA
jgi:hypothetical protein